MNALQLLSDDAHCLFSFVIYVLGMSVFVAFFVLLLLLAESIPPAATDIPLIGMSHDPSS